MSPPSRVMSAPKLAPRPPAGESDDARRANAPGAPRANRRGAFRRRRLLPAPGRAHAQRRAGHQPGRRAGAHQRRGVPDLRLAGRRGLSGPAVRRGVPRASRRRPGAGRRLRAGLPAQPRRAAPDAVRQGARLHAVAHPQQRGRDHRRGDVLQGPDPRRAARGARTAARSPGGAGRDGRRRRPRDQEPARRHRGDGRAAAPPAARQRPGHGAGRRHHQRSQDGQRHRPGDPRLRPAGAAADGAHRGRPGAPVGGDARRQQGQARPGRGAARRRRRTCRWSTPTAPSWCRCSPTC